MKSGNWGHLEDPTPDQWLEWFHDLPPTQQRFAAVKAIQYEKDARLVEVLRGLYGETAVLDASA